ncbi:uncharacterized protein L969DRAFT_95185 [Mixia osmundae IAM 14324]|uniref:Aminotransferase class I/classII large domain-containing protein n=1 Tax=Mixia osmundae (strain CBS 9802 / IAM 14324 / JCM 22182 / KY 12970) TaxID=764103 RepID=G7E6X3_MIXOS|nr:uncharacterized protein L969DRAFT_95185 [Mixia osmundae IAM 14324]KEI39034.1 hypothetical protein L969DRAFT_95185 [Mixia osmundae IAM 14324]GAA98583.1 hypothetical protein E5Q_05270 [Mixia osmundae IAM 14324]
MPPLATESVHRKDRSSQLSVLILDRSVCFCEPGMPFPFLFYPSPSLCKVLGLHWQPSSRAERYRHKQPARATQRRTNASPLMQMLCKIFACQYSPECPENPVSLGVAENSLMHEDLLAWSRKRFELTASDLTYGTALKGSARLFSALIPFFEQRFKNVKPILPQHIVTGAGVSAVIDQLMILLCDPSDGCLIAAPFYAGFDRDLRVRNDVIPIGVQIPGHIDPASPDSLNYLQARYDESKTGKGPKIKAVILCNPHNPLGFCYPRETIVEYARFAERNNLHLIVDEIYALSTFKTTNATATPFCSILSIDVEHEAGCDPSRVHMLYGSSKDFCSNGLRIGVMISQSNPALCEAFTSSAMFMKISSPADALFSKLISTPADLDWFISTNQLRLAQAYEFSTKWLKKHGVPYRQANAGHFLWIDLRKFMPTCDNEGKDLSCEADRESQLFINLLEHGVYIAPGSFYHASQPGFFRITFSVVQEVMQVGLDRLAAVIEPDMTSSVDTIASAKGNKRLSALELTRVDMEALALECGGMC